jgi:hypothetical protein
MATDLAVIIVLLANLVPRDRCCALVTVVSVSTQTTLDQTNFKGRPEELYCVVLAPEG